MDTETKNVLAEGMQLMKEAGKEILSLRAQLAVAMDALIEIEKGHPVYRHLATDALKKIDGMKSLQPKPPTLPAA